MTLKELYNIYGAERYGQDKFGQHYAELYDIIFAPFQDEDINVFEVGYRDGGSARLWLDYFTKAKIWSIDIDPNTYQRHLDYTNNVDLIQSNFKIDSSRINLTIIDSKDLTTDYFKGLEPTIAIDDGSHKLADQINFVKTVYPVLKSGGLLIIEDVQDIDRDKPVFEGLGIPFYVADLRPKGGPNCDSVLVIYQK